MPKRLLFSILLITACAPAFAGDTARALFIGNSFTGVNDLPEQTRLLADSKGDVLIKTADVIGGATLQMFSTDANTLALIDAGGWDVVVLQEQSEAPAFPDYQVQQDVYPYVKILCDRIRQKDPCAKIMLYMTWGHKYGDPPNCPNYPPLCTYEGMDSLLRLRYEAMSDSNHTLLCPVGGTFRMLRTLYPAINLYASDDYHPSPEGTYAGACSFYSAIFHKSPVGASYIFSIAQADATTIQNVAKSVVQDSLAFWSQWWIPTLVPHAAFGQTISGKTAVFSNSSVNAGSYAWSFGDGGTSVIATPSHTYAANGSYVVRLIIKTTCGDADTFRKTIAVNATGVGNTRTAQQPRVYPNPVSGILHLDKLDGRFRQLILRDVTGKAVKTVTLPTAAPGADVDMAALPSGSYELELTGNDGTREVFRIGKVK